MTYSYRGLIHLHASMVSLERFSSGMAQYVTNYSVQKDAISRDTIGHTVIGCLNGVSSVYIVLLARIWFPCPSFFHSAFLPFYPGFAKNFCKPRIRWWQDSGDTTDDEWEHKLRENHLVFCFLCQTGKLFTMHFRLPWKLLKRTEFGRHPLIKVTFEDEFVVDGDKSDVNPVSAKNWRED